MQAIQFNLTIPRYAVGLALQPVIPSILWSGRSCTAMNEVAEPSLPSDEWVKIKTRYGGICGTDLGAIHLHGSPYYTAFTSFPFTFGHESVGHIVQVGSQAGRWQVGDRVVIEPILWCVPRGYSDLCRFCRAGEINLCERFGSGDLPPGMLIGNCAATGGSWSPAFVAHASQLYRVPEAVSDENALMVEPFACALHAALRHRPSDDATVLIVGAGTIGLCMLAALRALGSRATVLVLARYPFQAEAARKLGATATILTARGQDSVAAVAYQTGARLVRAMLGERVVVGGVDYCFECVGSDGALSEALRLTRNRGTVVLLGKPGITKKVDWTPVFAKELTVHAAITYNHAEPFGGEQGKTFDLALDLLRRGEVDLGWLVTHRFALDDYDHAFRLLSHRRQSNAIKAVFAFDE